MMKKNRRKVSVFFVSAMISLCVMGCGEDDSDTVKYGSYSTPYTASEERSSVEDEETAQQQIDTDNYANDPDSDGGGNAYNSSDEEENYEFDILVDKDEYIYNNKPIDLDDLISAIDERKGEKIVFITGKEATLNAYNALINKLTEKEIPFQYSDL